MNEAVNPKSAALNNESLGKTGRFPWKTLFKIFLFRIPLWAIVSLLLIFGGWIGYSNITKENPANLRPIITNAIKVEITITTCNENIDKAGIDIRNEERRLEKKFRDIEEVDNAEIFIERDQKTCSLLENAGK